MAEFLWKCAHCGDSVRGNMKHLVYSEAEKHTQENHARGISVNYDDIKQVKD